MKQRTEVNAFSETEPIPWKASHVRCWVCVGFAHPYRPQWSVTETSAMRRRWACARHLHQVCASMTGPLYIEGMLDA